jgi:hypothetical protein
VKYFQALNTLRNGKKNETPQEELTAAAKVVNEFRNRLRLRRLKRIGYSDAEAQTLLYTPPDPPAA